MHLGLAAFERQLQRLGVSKILYNTVCGLAFVKSHELVILDPLGFERIDVLSRSALELHFLQDFGERLYILCHTTNKLVVSHINSTAQKLSALRIRPSNDKIQGAHDVPLKSSGDQSIDMFSYRHKDLASKMAALLPTMQLVFKMDRRSTVLGKELCKFHYMRKTAVAK